MFPILRISLFLIPLLLSGCALHYQKPLLDEHKGKILNRIENKVTLKPSGSYEECVALKRGQILVYRFSSTRPVDFNIHYHLEAGIQYPVLQNEATDYNGTFDPEKNLVDPDKEEFFCLMWENHDFRQSNLSYECEIKEK